MGTQRNNPQSKGKEESPRRVLNEIEASKLSDTEFKPMVIKKLNECRKRICLFHSLVKICGFCKQY